MNDIWEALLKAVSLVLTLDTDLLEIVGLSLQLSLTAVGISLLIGLPLAALLALTKFPGRKILIVATNVFMGLPPVVVGLIVYVILSRSGPLGVLGLLFTPTAMVIAQVILVIPIVTAISRQVLEDYHQEYDELLTSLGVSKMRRISALLWDARFALTTAGLAGFGRAASEVGAVMIVGGNIDHLTRVMTTAIALESRKGDLVMALALGIVLITLALGINLAAYLITETAKRRYAA
ncbi:ABC transporter permease [Curvivirga aplysinae]|uniref:ABC transporter permease n=1 Tax=Curvivirga aplysinae TaxID=2529852 RepID=UPI0012BC2F3A|nr:ABC transporter permease [Curvivirga aplysinae]MTI10672.1 ABC transporter permease subunit [Curvivirga aplysinae]